MNVPFQDLARLHASIQGEIGTAISHVFDSSSFVGAHVSDAFEESLAEAHGRGGAAGCGSGTDALALSMRALGLGAGDEVIVPSMTFVASAEAVQHVGATPVIADVDPETLLLTAETVAASKTSSTKAVMPVHLYGNVVPYATMMTWRKEGLLVVEDAAQAHLGSSQGHTIGEAGHVACLSFYPGKNLGAAGDGGAVLSDDDEVIKSIKKLRDHGRASKYAHDITGWCSRLDGLQANILHAKLAHLAEWTASRRLLADEYRRLLAERSPLVPYEAGSVHHLLVTRVPAEHRHSIREMLTKNGIATGVHYPVPLSMQPALACNAASTPSAEKAAGEVLSLPMDPLMTLDEVSYVCARLFEALAQTGHESQ